MLGSFKVDRERCEADPCGCSKPSLERAHGAKAAPAGSGPRWVRGILTPALRLAAIHIGRQRQRKSMYMQTRHSYSPGTAQQAFAISCSPHIELLPGKLLCVAVARKLPVAEFVGSHQASGDLALPHLVYLLSWALICCVKRGVWLGTASATVTTKVEAFPDSSSLLL